MCSCRTASGANLKALHGFNEAFGLPLRPA